MRIGKYNLMYASLVAGVLFLCASPVSYAIDPTKTVGSDACLDCHGPEHDAWVETTHSRTYDEMATSDAAAEISEALDIYDIEDPEGTCVDCHYTMIGEEIEFAEPIAGISCESCHGAATEWIDGHGNYESGDAETETAAQKEARISAAAAAGQIRPSQINLIAANCLECHTVPNEELVNVGGHPAGSDFELVSWSQGEVRHNLFWSGGSENAEASPERKRVLYVVGWAADLEFSLRALGKSQEAGTYRSEMQARIANALSKLTAINNASSNSDVAAMLSAGQGVDASSPDAGALNSAADAVHAAAQSFTASNDGGALAGLDGLIPGGEGHFSSKYN